MLLQYQVLSAEVLMLQRGTAGRAAAEERVHCQLGEAVIGTDKEVETTYMMLLIIWRAMGRYGTGVVIPQELDCMRLMLPGLDGAKVNLLLVKLGG